MSIAYETTAAERFGQLGGREDAATYNYDHFQASHLLTDLIKSIRGIGIQPGSFAPDFELPSVQGGTVTLSGLRGKPVLLHFGSYT